MRSPTIPSIVCAGVAVVSALGSSVSCTLETSDMETMGGAGGMDFGVPSGGTGGTLDGMGAGGAAGGAAPPPSGGSAGVMMDSNGGMDVSSGGAGGSTADPMNPMGGAGGDPIVDGGAGGMDEPAGGAGGSAEGGSGDSGECVTGQTRGEQVAMIGESFIAFTHQITREIETRAKAAGALAQDETYIDNSVSGTTLANNQIGSQYTDAVQESGDIKYVLMDGGGNDCLINNNGTAALGAAEALFDTMAENGTEKVVYFFYPDPVGANFASLKSCLDEMRPKMKAICDELTMPKCYWLDLRDVWNGHDEYTSDGIHPTTEGSVATGQAIWEVMQENCVAQ